MRSKMARFGVVGLIAAAASLLTASSKKDAWQWTLEERIANRTNPSLARERIARGRRVQMQSNPNLATIVDRFDGKTHPELFLPHEVFDELVQMTVASQPRTSQAARAALAPEVRSHGLPPDFWERLQSITTIYVADMQSLQDIGVAARQDNAPGRRRAESALEIKRQELCRSSSEALATAREVFGREKLDRFLYDVIAVHMFYAADRVPDPALLRKTAGGCR